MLFCPFSLHLTTHLFFLSVDPAGLHNRNLMKMQKASMFYLIHDPFEVVPARAEHLLWYLKDMNLVAEDIKDTVPGPCRWKGVQCVEKIVRQLQWSNLDIDFNTHTWNIHIEWMPSTVAYASLRAHKVYGLLHTRRLPRCSNFLDLSQNCFRGSFDAAHLPTGLIRGDFRQNNLSGIVYLENLPADLEGLFLSQNDFSHVVVDNATLPQGDCVFTYGRTSLLKRNNMAKGVQTDLKEKSGGIPDPRVQLVSADKGK